MSHTRTVLRYQYFWQGYRSILILWQDYAAGTRLAMLKSSPELRLKWQALGSMYCKIMGQVTLVLSVNVPGTTPGL